MIATIITVPIAAGKQQKITITASSLTQANEALQQAMMQLGQAVYSQSGGAGQQSQAQPNGHGTAGNIPHSDDEDVVEGEFTKV